MISGYRGLPTPDGGALDTNAAVASRAAVPGGCGPTDDELLLLSPPVNLW